MEHGKDDTAEYKKQHTLPQGNTDHTEEQITTKMMPFLQILPII